jgi:hypothetical protein
LLFVRQSTHILQIKTDETQLAVESKLNNVHRTSC